ncbi:MAG: signal recognition particle protein [Clostridia bacterium]|nr:signal recognition particle protein [Clostridia bacterium]
MAFENLGDKLQDVFKGLRSKGKLTESDIKTAMREVKLALLEADVNFKVVKDFVKSVSEKALEAGVLESLTPGQNVIKIVRDELTKLMGSENERIKFANTPPTVIMMCGLQGAGKTTATGKLALSIRKQFGKRPIMVACDVYRPAAVKQLEVLGAQINVPVFSLGTDVSPVEIAKKAVEHAKIHGNDPVIIDTAGRLHIDEALMQELKDIKAATKPDEILLVVDAMTGQDAVNVSESFNSELDVTGVILSKLDGDTRGGAALSVRAVTDKPIKYASMGEKLSDLEPFHPERMASRILGMGDVLTLIDKAQEVIDEEEAAALEKKMREQSFDLEDFLGQIQQIKKLGSFGQILGMLPGIDKKAMDQINTEETEKKMKHTEAIIRSMTPQERKKPQIIAASRKVRIAKGSGTRVQDVNELLKQFDQMKKMMKELSGPKQAKLLKRMQKMKGKI